MSDGWVDIHCHLLPGIDDGADDLDQSLAMARLAFEQGTSTVIVTPHQLGNFRSNRAGDIRSQTDALQLTLNAQQIPLVVLPGADVRIEDDLPQLLDRDEVLTLADHRKHLLLELPHELYFPLEPVLESLQRRSIVGILSHPERNRGILRDPEIVGSLIEQGCLMQVTTGSLTGSFGPQSQRVAELLLSRGWVHFLATDAHGHQSRRPMFRTAFERAAEIAGEQTATAICRDNPRLVAEGRDVASGPMPVVPAKRSWRFWKKAG